MDENTLKWGFSCFLAMFLYLKNLKKIYGTFYTKPKFLQEAPLQ